jgi:hypothetical protein
MRAYVIRLWQGELHEWLPQYLRELDNGRPHSVRELDEGIPHWVRELWKFSPTELEEWMQHAEKPRRMRSFKELTNLITKFLPSKIEELLQVEKVRERWTRLKEDLDTRLKEDLENDWKFSGMWFNMNDVDFLLIKLVDKQIKLAEKRVYCDKVMGLCQILSIQY